MAKRNKSKLVNLILMIGAIACAVVAYVGMLCNFITEKTTAAGLITVTNDWNLKEWFANIDLMKDFDKIANWQVASVLLIVTAVLMAIMLVVMLLKGFSKKSALLKWSTFAVACATFACSVAFLILTLIGCNDLSYVVKSVKTGVEYIAQIGVYLFSIGAMVASSVACAVALRK